MIHWRGESGGVLLAFTDRSGGVSQVPYEGLNLAQHVGDDADTVRRNRALLAAELAIDGVVFMNQVHGSDVAVIEDTPEAAVTCDAVVTARPGLALGVLVADCTPVLLHDEAAGLVGAVHAGRPGMLAGVVPRTVATMRELGARRLRAVVGPSVCGRCYEVPLAMREGAAAVAPMSRTVSWTGTPALDVAAGVVAQLAELEVPLTWVAGCSREDELLYSYRRDGQTGRFAGVVVRRAA